MNTNNNAFEKLSPGELFAVQAETRSPIDPNKSISELSYGELLMLEQHKDWLDEYNEKRMKIRLAEMSSEETDEITEGELIRQLYGSKNR